MLAKTIFAATFLALAQFAVATPPACLLGAVNTYDDPSDIKTVCKSKDLSSKVEKYCGDSASTAMDALADICNEQGVKVATAVSGSASATKTASGSHASGTGSAGFYPTGSSGNSTVPIASGGPAASGGAATGTSSGGPPESTGAAGRMEIGVAAILAGLMAVAL
ncbi:hypothetical protein T440DRAFT_469698 [Plenodomus tracheiphilus IPT5]|uniref:Extracellular membrane protein CFEM domain-containing protein n=1 Tax=Plenodomus tracheiphilus IPT5 TaxID=1408161 RepID=A0A6A7B2R7_9PLEO|nr:hypothetical protein T440DRAFT_469698 [Plenodomus tracheiphilus IPT5]